MIDCLLLGDSIAVGVGRARPECAVQAEVGIGSAAFLRKHGGPHKADTVAISLGSNDAVDIRGPLTALRRQVEARRVYWILPAKSGPQERAVIDIARENGDAVLTFKPGADGVHPATYGALSQFVGRP